MDILISKTELWFDINMKAMQFVVMNTHTYTLMFELSMLNTMI